MVSSLAMVSQVRLGHARRSRSADQRLLGDHRPLPKRVGQLRGLGRAVSRFGDEILTAIRDGKILGIRTGSKAHRIIGIWAVVVERRVFVRSWTLEAGGWYRTVLEEPRGVIAVHERKIAVRAVRTRSERLKDAVSHAYRAKYDTPGAIKYVRDLNRAKSRATTTELVPAGVRRAQGIHPRQQAIDVVPERKCSLWRSSRP